LDDILQSDNLNTFIDGSFDTGDIVIGDSEAQQPGVNFEELDLPLTGGFVEDRADTTLTLVENPPNPVPGQWGEYGDLKGSV
jgi:hypothetical protein